MPRREELESLTPAVVMNLRLVVENYIKVSYPLIDRGFFFYNAKKTTVWCAHLHSLS